MDSQKLVELAAKAADELKALNIKLIQIDMVSSIADWIMISEGLSSVQVRSITKSIEDNIRKEANISPLRKEGINEGKWALLDYGDIIINIFRTEERSYYELELFWSHGDKYMYKSNDQDSI